jgi:hypothetical protein
MGLNRSNVSYYLQNQIASGDKELTGKVIEKEVEISSAEILALYTTPKTLVAAPGAGKVLQFMGAVGFLDFNSAAYTTRGIVTVKYTDGSGTAVSDSVAAAALIQQADDCYEEFAKNTTETELTVNAPLVLTCDTGNPVTGDSPLTIKIFYRVLDFS